MMQDWIAQLGDKLLHERGHQLPLVASLLVGCVLLWSIAQPVWRMLQGTQGVEVVPQAVAQATEVLPEFELAQLRALALFPAQSRAALAQLDAPETKLALVLKGILTGDEWRPASAIISRGERSPDEMNCLPKRCRRAVVRVCILSAKLSMLRAISVGSIFSGHGPAAGAQDKL